MQVLVQQPMLLTGCMANFYNFEVLELPRSLAM